MATWLRFMMLLLALALLSGCAMMNVSVSGPIGNAIFAPQLVLTVVNTTELDLEVKITSFRSSNQRVIKDGQDATARFVNISTRCYEAAVLLRAYEPGTTDLVGANNRIYQVCPGQNRTEVWTVT